MKTIDKLIIFHLTFRFVTFGPYWNTSPNILTIRLSTVRAANPGSTSRAKLVSLDQEFGENL